MEISEPGYRFATVHNEDGNVAHVDGHYERFQIQAPIQSMQRYELEFYGKGAGIELGVTSKPRRAVPAAMAAVRRAEMTRPDAVTSTSIDSAGPATATLGRTARPDLSNTPTPPSSSVSAMTVGPEFHSPFDENWFEGMGIEQPPFPPPNWPPEPPGGGGGSGSIYHSAVRIELFVYGEDEPIATWELPEGLGPTHRTVKYDPQGYPAPDAPVRRTGWWRMTVTPLGSDPVMIYIAAHVKLGEAPIRTTPLTVRLTDHLFRVGLEALVPRAVVQGDRLFVSIGPEIAELIGLDPTILEESISPGISQARLRSLDITAISGAKLHTIALAHYRERALRYAIANDMMNLTDDQKVLFYFKKQLERLAEVKDDFVCIRIQAQFTDASLSVWGFDVASLNGEAGELVLAFDYRMERLRVFSFLDIKISALGSLGLPVMQLFKEVPRDVNKFIEDHLIEKQADVLKYFKGFVGRAVEQNAVVYDIKLQNKAWHIRHSEDPVIPAPGRHTRPPVDGGPIDDGVIPTMLARAGALGGISVGGGLDPHLDLGPSTIAAATRTYPQGYLTEGEQLNRLDRHQSIVVIMMENRSYDHMLGDLMNRRPRPEDPYDGPPSNATNVGVAGFLHGVPLVHTRDLRIGTAIPVSPRHSFNPVQFQIGDGTEEGRGTGDMNGFARDLYHRSDSPQLAMTVYGEEDLPVHYELAEVFCTCDRWFAAHPGPTFPNRFATLMGTIPDLDNFENEDPRIGYLKNRNVFDALSGAGIDWRVFESDLSFVRMFDRYRIDDTHVVPINDSTDGLEATLRKPGPLPRVMFIEPNFANIPPLKTADDDHPPADLKHGQAFLSRMCDLLWDTERFDEVLLVITYDEHGGFYDHVPPPGTAKGAPGVYPPLIEGGPTYLGVRVPTFVVSPFVSAHKIDRTIFDHTSIIKTILVHNRAKLADAVLLGFGERVNQAKDLSVVLDLSTPRPSPVPFVRRGGRRPPPRFGELVDFASVVEMTSSLTPSTTTTISQAESTPRLVTVTERTVLPEASSEPRDFHAALAKMLKPRRRR